MSVVGDRRHGENFSPIQQYVDILCQEIRQTAAHSAETAMPLKTVFLGGGTPSLLAVHQLEQILATLDQEFGIESVAEISLEIDPGTFDLSKLQGFVQLGVNRVSLGVQAFQDQLLQLCGRSHTVAEVFGAIDLIHQVDLSNFSIDLISGLPHQTLEQWQESLSQAIKISPTHISHYDLIVEPVTAFGRQYEPGQSPLPSDVTAAQMYRLAQQTLSEAGYQHYEVSNYAQPGWECRHNLTYWQNETYYGFGMGAASFVQGYRLTRPRQRRLYFDWVETNDYVTEAEWVESSEDRLLETLMLGLRLARGLSLSQLVETFGQPTVEQLLDCLEPYQKRHWVEITPENRIRLSDPEGFLFSNTVLSSLFSQFS